jgi:uncharacterized membrane protein
MQGYDEPSHFLRAYQVSEGHLSAELVGKHNAGGVLPANVVAMQQAFFANYIREFANKTPDWKNGNDYKHYLTVFSPGKSVVATTFVGSAVYSPVNYLPQAAGILVGRILHLPLLSYIYLGRLAKAAAFIALAYWALKVIPAGKWLLFTIFMLPSNISAAATFSPDPLVIACIALIVAYFVKYLKSGKLITNRDYVIIGALLVTLVLLKQAYFPLIALFLFLPYRSFSSLKRYITINTLYIVVSTCFYVVWTIHVKPISDIIHYAQLPGQAVNPTQQLSNILHDPIGYARIFTNNFISPGQTILTAVEMVSWVTWKYIKPPYFFVLLSYFTLFYGGLVTYSEAFMSKTKQKLNLVITRYGSLLIIAAMILIMYTIFYITTSITGGPIISGIQGRYFLPVLPLFIPFLLSFKKPELKIGEALTKKLLFNFCFIVLLITAIEVFIVNFTTMTLA